MMTFFHLNVFHAAAQELASGDIKVAIKDGAIVGSVWGPEGIMPRITGRMDTKPYAFNQGDHIAIVLPAYIDFLEKSFADGICTGGFEG